MKGSALILFVLLPFVALAPLRTNCTLHWDYPAHELSINLTFKLYSTTNIGASVSTWPLLTTIVGTNTSFTLPIDAQQRWFVMTASNWWGESVFSNVAATPAPPRSDVNLRLGP